MSGWVQEERERLEGGADRRLPNAIEQTGKLQTTITKKNLLPPPELPPPAHEEERANADLCTERISKRHRRQSTRHEESRETRKEVGKDWK